MSSFSNYHCTDGNFFAIFESRKTPWPIAAAKNLTPEELHAQCVALNADGNVQGV